MNEPCIIAFPRPTDGPLQVRPSAASRARDIKECRNSPDSVKRAPQPSSAKCQTAHSETPQPTHHNLSIFLSSKSADHALQPIIAHSRPPPCGSENPLPVCTHVISAKHSMNSCLRFTAYAHPLARQNMSNDETTPQHGKLTPSQRALPA